MKNIIVLMALFFAGFWTVPASAKNYVSGDVGIVWLNNITDNYSTSNYAYPMFFQTTYNNRLAFVNSGFSMLGALGSECGNVRIEGEVGYQRSNINNFTSSISSAGSFLPSTTVKDLEGNASVISFLANAYYDIHSGGVEPYITAGIGVASINFNDINAPASSLQYSGSSSNGQATAIAYQIGAGAVIPLSNTVKLDARYRYFSTGKIGSITTSALTVSDFNVISNSILLGVRVDI
ncbi:MAG: outer membrane beta-barrel protein [Chlorobiales bacterium]|nr:outer membrane beta-barrel protein [Chlorobiales bacterium]